MAAGWIETFERGPEGGFVRVPKGRKPHDRGERRYKAAFRADDGKVRSKRFTRKSDAEGWLAGQVSDVDEGTWRDPELARQPLGPYLEAFLESAKTLGDLRPATVSLYRDSAERFILPRFGSAELGSITPAAIRAWMTKHLETGATRRTVEIAQQALSRTLRQAVADDILLRNPASGTRLKKQDREPISATLSPADVWAIAEALREPWEGRYRPLVILMGFCGLRIGEAAGLADTDLDLLHGTLTIRKGVSEVRGVAFYGPPKTKQAVRTIVLPAVVREALAEHLEAHPPVQVSIRNNEKDMECVRLVFTGPDGGVLRRTVFRNRVWAPTLEKLGMGEYIKRPDRERRFKPSARPHDLRHAAVSAAINLGADVLQVQRMVGHAKPTITLDCYAHLFASRETELAESIDAMVRDSAFAANLLPEGPSEVRALPAAGA